MTFSFSIPVGEGLVVVVVLVGLLCIGWWLQDRRIEEGDGMKTSRRSLRGPLHGPSNLLYNSAIDDWHHISASDIPFKHSFSGNNWK
jgi:hypothetical protein